MIEVEGIRKTVISTTNILLETKKVNPGSDDHAEALSKLTELLASKPGAVEVLRELQKQR